MRPDVQTLKAEIRADLQAIEEIYGELDRLSGAITEEDRRIIVAYFLHNLYTAFESIFQRITRVFGNGASEDAGWHADLLRRMSLDIEGLRPRVISRAAHQHLDELRRFRDLFRSGYRLHFDPVRLGAVLDDAEALRDLYRTELNQFLSFLDGLPPA